VCALGLSCGLRPQPNWSVGRAQWIHNKTRPFKAFIHSSSSTDPRAVAEQIPQSNDNSTKANTQQSDCCPLFCFFLLHLGLVTFV
jgi:hypothetical protein